MADVTSIRPHSIFLHGGWRCGSTYLWNKFRELDDVTAFYEPFSEKLASYTPTDILKDVARGTHATQRSINLTLPNICH